MKLKELAIKPQLTKITIDSEALVEYTKLASVKTDDFSSMIDLVKELVLDEDGNPVMDDEHVLPTDILNEAMVKVVDVVGK